MAYILHIDTSMETAQIGLAHQGELLATASHAEQKDHAGFLQPAIAALMEKVGISLQQLAAVAVTSGPGSYTGLRVGMASAKGLCYALQVPLITIGTLTLMAASAIAQKEPLPAGILYCPMIDARRMEVFTALFDDNLVELKPPTALILDETSFSDILTKQMICFFGSGSAKFRPICPTGAHFLENFNISMLVFAQLSLQLFDSQQFSDTAYSEPAYHKAFFSTQKR